MQILSSLKEKQGVRIYPVVVCLSLFQLLSHFKVSHALHVSLSYTISINLMPLEFTQNRNALFPAISNNNNNNNMADPRLCVA
jgi:hypothetical protein